MNDADLAEVLAKASGERVTKEYMESRIGAVKYTRLGETMTHCALYLDNGFVVSGESACVDPQNFNYKVGERLAYDQAFDKLWPLFGFLLAEKRRLS